MTESAKDRAIVAISGQIEAQRADFTRALANRVDPEVFMSVALDAARNNPSLLNVVLNAPDSILKALHDAATLALVPNGVMGSAYLVPRFNKNTRRTEAYFQAGYRGLVELAIRSGHVSRVESRVVYAGDEFDMAFGTTPTIHHKPTLDDSERGPVIGVYAVGFMRDGGRLVEWMTVAQIEAVRRRAPASDSGPWVTDYEEMARKTVVRRLCKSLPMSVEVQRAIALDDSALDADAPEQPVAEQAESRTLADRIRKAKAVSPEPVEAPEPRVVEAAAVVSAVEAAVEAAGTVESGPVSDQDGPGDEEDAEPSDDLPDEEDEQEAVPATKTYAAAVKPPEPLNEWDGTIEPGPKGMRFAHSTWKAKVAYADAVVQGVIESIGEPTPATIGGLLDYIPWEKDGKAQPPYRQITVYIVTVRP